MKNAAFPCSVGVILLAWVGLAKESVLYRFFAYLTYSHQSGGKAETRKANRGIAVRDCP